jgi:hypothetical protein
MSVLLVYEGHRPQRRALVSKQGKENAMSGPPNVPEILLVNSNADAFKKFGMALVIGAVLVVVVGLQSGKIVTDSNAQMMIRTATDTAVAAALLPECTRKFSANSEAMTKFKAETSSWSRGNIVSGTIKDIDGTAVSSSLAEACARSVSDAIDKSAEKKS